MCSWMAGGRLGPCNGLPRWEVPSDPSVEGAREKPLWRTALAWLVLLPPHLCATAWETRNEKERTLLQQWPFESGGGGRVVEQTGQKKNS